jgi:hypothetical protein
MGTPHDPARCPHCRAPHDPECCPHCKASGTTSRGKIIESRHEGAYRRRRRKCPVCALAWTSYESTVNVEPVITRHERRRAAAESPARSPAAPPTAAPAPVAKPPATPGRRVTRSTYLG